MGKEIILECFGKEFTFKGDKCKSCDYMRRCHYKSLEKNIERVHCRLCGCPLDEDNRSKENKKYCKRCNGDLSE